MVDGLNHKSLIAKKNGWLVGGLVCLTDRLDSTTATANHQQRVAKKDLVESCS